MSAAFWTCAVLSPLIVGMGALSGRWCLGRSGQRSHLLVASGLLQFHWNARRAENDPVWTGWGLVDVEAAGIERWHYELWYFALGTNAIFGWRYLIMPLWAIAIVPLTGAVGCGVWRRNLRRRHREGACVACGYDVRGLSVEAPCPECGARRSPAAPT